MHATILICSASLALLTLLLAFWTSIQRGSRQPIAYDAPLDPTSGMAKAQRAHGNAAEYAGLLIGLFLIAGFAYQGRDLGGLMSWSIIAVTAARFVHALGFLICASLEKPHVLKMIGALVTYLGGLLIAGLTLAKAI